MVDGVLTICSNPRCPSALDVCLVGSVHWHALIAQLVVMWAGHRCRVVRRLTQIISVVMVACAVALDLDPATGLLLGTLRDVFRALPCWSPCCCLRRPACIGQRARPSAQLRRFQRRAGLVRFWLDEWRLRLTRRLPDPTDLRPEQMKGRHAGIPRFTVFDGASPQSASSSTVVLTCAPAHTSRP